MARGNGKRIVLIGSSPWEGIKHAKDKAKQQQTRPGRKDWKVMLTWQSMLDPARLAPTMCHHKLPTAIVTLLTLSRFWHLILSSVA